MLIVKKIKNTLDVDKMAIAEIVAFIEFQTDNKKQFQKILHNYSVTCASPYKELPAAVSGQKKQFKR